LKQVNIAGVPEKPWQKERKREETIKIKLVRK